MTYTIGILGGSGLYAIPEVKIIEQREVDTPFGKPSAPLTLAELNGVKVAFLPRHGSGHELNPTAINVRANIYALKSVGVQWLVAVSAVGSLKESIAPRHLVVPDQIIDRTKSRVNTFFDDLAVHVGFADPFCSVLSGKIVDAAIDVNATFHTGGTYICMEGPLFSTRAESNLYRSWGASIIGMTALPEAKLAREAELAYGMVAVATDYDCWYTDEHVDVEMIIENLKVSLNTTQKILANLVPRLASASYEESIAANALKNAIITNPDYITPALRRKYGILLDKYLS